MYKINPLKKEDFPMNKKKSVALTVGAAGIAAWAASKAMMNPPPRQEKNALEFEKPIVLAKHGGNEKAPENTLAAFTHAAALGVHGFSVSIRLTNDEQIIVFHDEYVNRVTNLEGKVADYTLEELKQADAGYSFQDHEGQFPYRGKGLTILTLEELLKQFPHLFISIRIQETPDTYEGSLIPSKLWFLIEALGVKDKIAILSPFDEQVDRFNLYAQNQVAIGTGNKELTKAYTSYISQFGHFYRPNTDLFFSPLKLGMFPIGMPGFIHFLEKLNIPIYFTDVNHSMHIQALAKAGAAGFITNTPSLVIKALQSKIEA